MVFAFSMSVLVVDDASTVARIIRNQVQELGFVDVDEACSGVLALSKLRSKRYGLVISDWNMEPMSGLELLRQMRADPHLAEVPFIMVTAEARTENVIAAKNAGANNYIVKPFNLKEIKAKIEAVLAANAVVQLAC